MWHFVQVYNCRDFSISPFTIVGFLKNLLLQILYNPQNILEYSRWDLRDLLKSCVSHSRPYEIMDREDPKRKTKNVPLDHQLKQTLVLESNFLKNLQLKNHGFFTRYSRSIIKYFSQGPLCLKSWTIRSVIVDFFHTDH